MMAGNPNWWSMHPPSHHQQPPPPPNLPLNSFSSDFHHHELHPHSWSHLLMGGLPMGEEEKYFSNQQFEEKKVGNWEELQRMTINQESNNNFVEVKQEEIQRGGGGWSSPRSCVTSLSSSNMLDFSYNTEPDHHHYRTNNNHFQHPDHHSSSECNSTAATGGVCKKARVQATSSQPPLKVRKEKLGDRITALHQLVSPFGKTDTASVLLEAIGYIRFLQGQIEALSSPYFGTSSSSPPNMRNNQQSMLNDNGLKRKGGPSNQDVIEENTKDLKSRGLCLVPIACTQQVGSDINGADYWAPAALGGGF